MIAVIAMKAVQGLGNTASVYSGGGGSSSSSSPASSSSNLVNLVKFDTKIKDSLHPCLENVLNIIKSSAKGQIAANIQKFSGEIPGWNWGLIEGNLPTNVNGNTKSVISSDGFIYTTIDYNKLKNATILGSAAVIIHESIHAYLTVYFANDPINANKDYPGMLNAWYISHDINAIQHDQMVASFIDDIAASLKQIGISLGLNLDDQVYQDIAWGGLDFENNSQLSDDDKERIQNRLSAEQTSSAYRNEFPSSTKTCN